MESFEKLVEVVARLRGEGGCPWDREQTHVTLKDTCIEEAAEVVCGINILEKTGNASNLCEELGDLLLQVVMQAQIAQEEGLFTIEDVTKAITEKMIRRHPHVFGEVTVSDSGEVLKNWEEIKKLEKKGKIDDDPYIDDAFDESEALIERARKRKAEKRGLKQ
ncbi:MAG: MazG family protein [Lachnospiraceae bacterium]|nr:MazG family protein [Lachnospiraceae bacterium]